MNERYFILIGCLTIFGFITSCNSAKSQNEISDNINMSAITPEPISTIEPSSNNVLGLCDKLSEIKEMAYGYDEMVGDPIYDGLIKQGNKAIPCLIDKITDTTLMRDPGAGPARSENYRVGDTAVFMLLKITKEQWQPKTMLSAEYAKRWESDGIYAYFAYVEKPANRKKIQQWWKDWMKQNLN